MPTETVWVALTGADLGETLSAEAIAQLDEVVGAQSGDPLDPTDTTNRKSYRTVLRVISELRGAVRAGGRFPVSVTAGTVPPEGAGHVLSMAKWRLINSKPSLVQALMEQMPELNKEFARATAYFDEVRKGGTVAAPSYPAGADYLTAVSTTNLAVSGVEWGDIYGDEAEYEAGERTTDDGTVITLPEDEMTQR